ncbi:diguanylate cyclase/phosphodiesterase (GGDEF & EAL domains) with PAS/PAC sensor [Chitinispirillum alkaliphilum]|nr:diguanylate cyclase/phosphodiesterase (GGDEF & EAL domains) with PAS/PAC sensor [Chitinispirillum alkaliphilum]
MSENTKTFSTSLSREARFQKEMQLDSALLEILTAERKGSMAEKRALLRLRKKMKGQIYVEAIYLLAHIIVENAEKAQEMFQNIIEQRHKLQTALQRHVSIQVAALDYLQNVCNILQKPTILETDKYEEFCYRSTFDNTTQAFEKDLLDADLDLEIENAKVFGTTFSLLFIDIDNLKLINDSFGHQTGTKSIQFISESIRNNLRNYDSVYRYGGDEFVVLLPRCTQSEAFNTARRILDLINRKSSALHPLHVSVSIGSATFDNDSITEKPDLISAADTALYEAKRSGKNNIRVYVKKHSTGHQSEKKRTPAF